MPGLKQFQNNNNKFDTQTDQIWFPADTKNKAYKLQSKL